VQSLCCSFDNMKVSIFGAFGLKKPIHAPNRFFLGEGGFYFLNVLQYQQNPHKAHPCASPRRLSHHQAIKSVDR